jgi:hypothetical protein
MQKRIIILIAVFIALFSVSLTALAEAMVMNLRGGDSIEINCDGSKLNLTRINTKKIKAECKGSASAPTNTPVPATNTPVPQATNTPTPTSGGDLAGKECPAWVHDQHVVEGPDGNMYPTWHPQIDPQYSCYFTHEHGADPRSSNIFTQMPTFGYIAKLSGMSMPHEGYKVFVLNRGTTSEGKTAPDDHLLYFHMGTAGVGRYTNQFHEFGYAYIGDRGEFRVTGLADTGGNDLVGSTCSNPRKGGRDFSTVGCNDSYEIWNNVHFSIIHPNDPFKDPMHVRLYISGSVAAFDPITTRDPNDSSRLLYTAAYRNPNQNIDPLSSQSPYRGCNREGYFGPNYFNNANRSTTYWTDVYGKVQSGSGPGLLEQFVSASNSTDNRIFKYREPFCGPNIHAPN